MNEHLNDGQLRAALDGELDAKSLEHLAACAECRSRQTALQATADAARRSLSFLVPAEREPGPSAQSAMKHFHDRKLTQKENSVFKRLFASSAVRYAALAVLVLALVIAIPGTRALADELLNLFRVQQVTVVPVDFTGLQDLTGNDALGKQISQLISSSITMNKKPGEPLTFKDDGAASAKVGFNIRVPENKSYSHVVVQDGAAFDFTVDRTKAQALINEAGRSDLVLPQDIDGAVISVKVPASAMVEYGTCPDLTTEQAMGPGSRGRLYADCVILSEIPSPTVDAPANVDVAQLAQIGLEFTGMSADQAKAFTQSVDWQSTLVVPIPKNAATYQQVQVDGVTGTLIQRPADDAPQYLLIWIKDGIVYSVGGLGSDSQQAIDMANSLH